VPGPKAIAAPDEKTTEKTTGLLSGIRVLDLTRVVAGPTCTRALADLGADVFKIEPPDGDLLRRANPRVGGVAVVFTQQNAGKSFLCVDLGRDGATELVLRMAARCDVVVENFRGGVADRLGVGYEAVRARRADIVYCSISGYGQDGPAAHRRAYAPVVHAELGLIHYKAEQRDTQPLPEPVSHADLAVGMQAAQGVLAALFRRERNGEGCHIDASMAEAMLAANEWSAAEVNGGVDWDRSIFRPGKAAIVQVGDGTWVQIPGSPAGVLPVLARLSDREDLLDDDRFAPLALRNRHLDLCLAAAREIAAGYADFESFEHTMSEGARIPLGRVTPLAEVPKADWAIARGAFREVPSGDEGGRVLVNRGALRFSNAASGARGGGRSLGADNRPVLRELLGLDEAELERLEAAGVLVHKREGPEDSPW
jgi:crotonobetainyl-CoA:carnitine CoA-transferase CaiB-like acyl-CoA transferase